jgi:hypothetical protein
VEARTSGVRQDVASGAAGGFIGRQPVTFYPSTYLRRDYTANLDQSEIDGLEGRLRLYFRSAFLAL